MHIKKTKGDPKMDYKKMIIKDLDKLDLRALKLVYHFIRGLVGKRQ